MSELSEQEILEKLKGYNTPLVTNIVATYPGTSFCLGLYEPWRQNWYTNQSLRCIYPELGSMIGFAVTVVFSLPDPNYNQLSFANLIDALEKSKKPSIVVIKQDFPPEILPKVGLSGGQMTALFKACGAVGVVTDGPTRDIDEIRSMKFQYLTSGVTPGHGGMSIHAVNVPVSVAGMDVAPGEIIHMDENGACKLPADKLADVYRKIDGLVKAEEERIKAVEAAKNFEEIRAAWSKRPK